jgi:hypothetical protein
MGKLQKLGFNPDVFKIRIKQALTVGAVQLLKLRGTGNHLSYYSTTCQAQRLVICI